MLWHFSREKQLPKCQSAESQPSSSQTMSTLKGKQISVTICAIIIHPRDDWLKKWVGLSGLPCAEARTGWFHSTPMQVPPAPESRSRTTPKEVGVGWTLLGDLRPGSPGKDCITQTCVTQMETLGRFLRRCGLSSLLHCPSTWNPWLSTEINPAFIS